ncbi:DUF2207 domain-containing protein [Rhizorhabdus dicambivorans]|uniref:DUF2207 domain-containing protein n=1 Tax=Rhizorhabdus dicambivorans TaxID=1850238 RepID=A0A2A4FMV6_9SPHN|nr:DUF2207 domain-containing protein [Rhizorhabdus dicambivorans]ATE64792.1 DUF2207 domain-containing protein [Rhizorhabdus dicambivorans]PCE39733.1 DUF2207 domain-containing protein [Rhizorhabdus dicambivorans]
MRVLFACWLALVAWALPAHAQAIEDPAAVAAAYEKARGQERILAYSSDVHVARDGELDVTETIRLVSLADQIKRGIYRDFPTSYDNRYGQRTRVSFDLVSVSRDGKPEPYALEDLSNGVRIRIGDADTLLPPGEHVYAIRYRTRRQIVYLADKDEVYWNATGTGWAFPIDMAEARITLPGATSFGDRAVYTGPQGSTAGNAAVVEERPGFIHFRTTAPLDAYSGLTVAAAFPKGVLEPPTQAQKLTWWLQDWGPFAAGVALLGLLLLYFFYAWLRVGRGPRPGTLVPAFSPPDNLSPAACRYIDRMGADNRGFTAAIVDLAVRGHIGITKSGGGWLSSGTTVLDRREGGKPIPAPELAMRDTLLPGVGSRIELKQDNHATLQSASSKLNKGLAAAYQAAMFRTNRSWAAFGLLGIPAAVLAVVVVTFLVHAGHMAEEVMIVPLIGLGAVVLAFLLHRLTLGSGCLKVLAWVGIALCIVAILFSGFIALALAIEQGAWSPLLPLLALPFAITAFRWIAAPTIEGRRMMDRIDGFKHYLGITEEDRLDALHPPEKTPVLFERYLPYAIALDVENRWADKFAGVLAAAVAAGTAAHTASWYSGDGNWWDDPGGFTKSVGSSLASTVASASSSPSSSSGGSSGGGSSGGGGGGGGGGGW